MARETWDELLAAARAGDKMSLEQILSELRTPCWRFAVPIVRDGHLAEDVVQDALIILARKLVTIHGCVHAYARSVVVHCAIRALHAARRETLGEGVRAEPPDPAAERIDPLLRDAVGAALRELKPAYREAIQLAALGYTAAEIAVVQASSVHSAQNRILRGRKRAWSLLPAGARKRYPLFGPGITPCSVVKARNKRRRGTERP